MNNNLEYTKFSCRIAAGIIDIILLFILALLLSSIEKYQGRLLLQIILLTVMAVFTSSKYQGTPGKMFFGLKVTDLTGNRISFWRAFCRYSFYNLFSLLIFFIFMEVRTVSLSPILYCVALMMMVSMPIIGYLMILFTERKQGLHDKIAGTIVIKRKSA